MKSNGAARRPYHFRIYETACSLVSLGLASVAGFAFTTTVLASQKAGAPSEKEAPLIALLQSNAPPSEKALACKQLAIYGSEKAVPALAPLLADESLASWARIPLEVIPGPAADAALRQAVGRLHGKLLVGTINSIGVRRDAKAVGALSSKLKDNDANVASAAAVALGRIGGDRAAKSLKKFLPQAPAEVRLAVTEGCLRCAETLVAAGKKTEAVELYDSVRKADVPQYRQLEGARGAILALGPTALPSLLEQLRSADKAVFVTGLRTARELPGVSVTDGLVNEMKHSTPEKQPLLLLALADRGDATALPAVLDAAKTGPKKLRLAAVTTLLTEVKELPLPG